MESKSWAFSTRWCWEQVLQRHSVEAPTVTLKELCNPTR